ncbi:MAG: potassium channel family protein [archaeon]|nr:potassium channel family protein [archaeon]
MYVNDYSEEVKNEKIEDAVRDRLERMTHLEKDEWITRLSFFFLTNELKKKIRLFFESKLKLLDKVVILFSGIGLLTNALQSMIYLKFKVLDDEINRRKTIEVKGESSNIVELLRFITSVSTLIVVALLILHYKVRRRLLVFKEQVDLESSLASTGLLIPLIIEILVNLIHTPPFLNNITIKVEKNALGEKKEKIPVDIVLYLSVFTPFRVYLLFKYYTSYSLWTDDRAEKICKENNAEGGISFSLKSEIKTRPYLVLFCLLVASVVLIGYCLRNTEIAYMVDVPYEQFHDWSLMVNGFWCIILTMFTVGLGDFYPSTHFGRFICLVAVCWGIFLTSLIVVSLVNTITLNNKETKIYKEIKQRIKEKRCKEKALMFIYHYYKASKLCEDEEEEDPQIISAKEENIKYAIKKMKKKFALFHAEMKKSQGLNKKNSVENVINKINKDLNENLDYYVKATKYQTNYLFEQLRKLMDFQCTIIGYLKVMEVMTEHLKKPLESNKDNNNDTNNDNNDNSNLVN